MDFGTVVFATLFTALWLPVPFVAWVLTPRWLGWDSDAREAWFSVAWLIAAVLAVVPVALLWTHL